jgi:hypothetical protein
MTDLFARRFYRSLLGVLLLVVAGYYFWIHWRVVCLVEPATIREPAWIANVKGFLDAGGARPFSYESFPGNTNVYGIGYIWAAAPFGRLFPSAEWIGLRLGNAFFLGVLLLIIAYAAGQAALRDRAFGLCLVYSLFVGSPSIAAGPDVLACVFYTLAWVIVEKGNLNPISLSLSVALGFLGFITKPYVVVVVPAIATYLFLFRSLQSALIYTGALLVFFGSGFWLLRHFYPLYFVSTFGAHLNVGHHLWVAARQWGELLVLVPVPCFLAGSLGWEWIQKNARGVRLSVGWSKPLFAQCSPPSLYAWGSLTAAVALAAALSWRGGAHMIYFWHLLLPLLILLQLKQQSVSRGWLCINLLVLLVLRPPPPATGTPEVWNLLRKVVAMHPRTYLDGFTVSLQTAELGDSHRENALSECILQMRKEYSAKAGSIAELIIGKEQSHLLARADQYVAAEQRDFLNQKYDAILLIEGIFFKEHILAAISQHYRITAGYYVYSYYLDFRNRLNFGQYPIRILLYEPRHSAASNELEQK